MLARRLLLAGGGAGAFLGGLMATLEMAKVYSGSTQTIAHNTVTAFTFTAAEYDPNGYWSAGSPTKIKVPTGKGGVPFLILGGTYTNDMPAPDMSLTFAVNGGPIRDSGPLIIQASEQDVGFGLGAMNTGTSVVILNDGDEVTLLVYQDSTHNAGASMVFGHASSVTAQTWMAVVRLAT